MAMIGGGEGGGLPIWGSESTQACRVPFPYPLPSSQSSARGGVSRAPQHTQFSAQLQRAEGDPFHPGTPRCLGCLLWEQGMGDSRDYPQWMAPAPTPQHQNQCQRSHVTERALLDCESSSWMPGSPRAGQDEEEGRGGGRGLGHLGSFLSCAGGSGVMGGGCQAARAEKKGRARTKASRRERKSSLCTGSPSGHSGFFTTSST